MTTGKPSVSNDVLKSFSVDDGRVIIEGLGLNADNVDRVDIMARAVEVNARLQGNKLNIVTGRNDINYDPNQLNETRY